MTGATEQNEILDKMKQEHAAKLREQERTLKSLRELNESLHEENKLLRDFAYNVDPNARTLHAHKFNKTSISSGFGDGQKQSSRLY